MHPFFGRAVVPGRGPKVANHGPAGESALSDTEAALYGVPKTVGTNHAFSISADYNPYFAPQKLG